jgi:hypothetical protein
MHKSFKFAGSPSITASTLIYDIRRFVCKDIYFDTLLFSVIHFVLLLGQSDFDGNQNGGPKMGVVH